MGQTGVRSVTDSVPPTAGLLEQIIYFDDDEPKLELTDDQFAAIVRARNALGRPLNRDEVLDVIEDA